jgi:hypothetical protein
MRLKIFFIIILDHAVALNPQFVDKRKLSAVQDSDSQILFLCSFSMVPLQ